MTDDLLISNLNAIKFTQCQSFPISPWKISQKYLSDEDILV